MEPFPFQSNKVIEERISDANLRVFDAGFDRNIYRIKPLAEVIIRVLPEFALGYKNSGTLDSEIIDRLRDAAEILYKTDKYKSRGEFGELILHLLLRDFCNTKPLISKIYFKDANNVAVHGFDAIHITDDDNGKSLWLGEAKIYEIGKNGITELVNDLKNHFTDDYLRSEFLLIRNKVELIDNDNIEDKKHWLDLMHKHTTLDKIFQSITVPMLCVYDSDLYKKHNCISDEYIESLKKEVQELSSHFNDKSKDIKTNLNIILMLLPIPSKKELIEILHGKLKNLQNV